MIIFAAERRYSIMMIGRKEEQRRLRDAYESKYSEFAVVYGRRRVGKTFLIRETFDYKFTFQHTGLAKKNTRQQLQNFQTSLRTYGFKGAPLPGNWLEAFDMLAELVKRSRAKKKVVFIDEMPWMDAPGRVFCQPWNISGTALLLPVRTYCLLYVVHPHRGLPKSC